MSLAWRAPYSRTFDFVSRSAWPRVGKARPANGNRRRPEGAAYPANASAPGSRCELKMQSVLYATTTRAPPAGTCIANVLSNGKSASSLIWSPAAEHVRGLRGRDIRIYGQKRAMTWHSRLAAAGAAVGIWKRTWIGCRRVRLWGLKKTRSVADELGRAAPRRWTAAPGLSASLAPARALHLPRPQSLLLVRHMFLLSHRLKGTPSLKSYLTGSGEQNYSYWNLFWKIKR